jgi:hypothetical protein
MAFYSCGPRYVTETFLRQKTIALLFVFLIIITLF